MDRNDGCGYRARTVRLRGLTLLAFWLSVGCEQLANLHSLETSDGSSNAGGMESVSTSSKAGGRSSVDAPMGGRPPVGGAFSAAGGDLASGGKAAAGGAHEEATGGSGLGGFGGDGFSGVCANRDSFDSRELTEACWDFFDGPNSTGETFSWDGDEGSLAITPPHGTRFASGGLAPLLYRELEGDFVVTVQLRIYGKVDAPLAPNLAAYAGGGILLLPGAFNEEASELSGYVYLKLATSSSAGASGYPLFYYSGATTGESSEVISQHAKVPAEGAWQGADLRVCHYGKSLRYATRNRDSEATFLWRDPGVDAGPIASARIFTLGLLAELGSTDQEEPAPRVMFDQVVIEPIAAEDAFNEYCPTN